jgi:hypothetical protein
MIVKGLVLMIIGWLILFFQVLRLLPLSLLISFTGHGLACVGMIIGLIGIAQHRSFRPKDD